MSGTNQPASADAGAPSPLSTALADRYRIERELGAGGMATVYLAEDLKHHRKVAIKVLHADLSAVLGGERFLKEIELTANLQHPHILPLFDSGSAGGLLYYVMPFVEGESLRGRLTRENQLPVGDALAIAKAVASALDYAHRRGVVHRDIKPENILLQDGNALVADFGIALAVSTAGGQRLTQTGLSLGTPQYMAPEQAMGNRAVDARADIYALGAVLYEMLIGEPPFTGPNAQAILAQVITAEPKSLVAQRRSVPAQVEDAVLKATEKLPADRFASASEFSAALEGPSAAGRMPSSARRRATKTNARVVTGALIGVVALAGAAGWFARARTSRDRSMSVPPSRLALLSPGLGGSGTGGNNRQVTITPDGSAVVFVDARTTGAGGDLVMQQLDAESPVHIPNSTLTYAPSLSPDGRWLAVRDISGSVMRLAMTGSSQPPRPLAQGFAFYAWHPDGSLWVTRPPYTTIERLAPGSDSLRAALGPLAHGVFIQQILDDGRSAIVVDAGIGQQAGPCSLIDLRTGRETPLITTRIVAARYTSGYLLYATPDGELEAQAFDPGAGGPTGRVITIASGISITGAGDAQFDASRGGTVVYVPEEPRSLVLVDRTGAAQLATDERHSFHIPRFSPDGHKLSFDFVNADGRDVWLLDLGQKTLTRVTFQHDDYDATWMPDGRALSYTSQRNGRFGIYRVSPGSMTPPDSLLDSPALNFTGEWLPDASALVTVAVDLHKGSNQDIAIVRNGGRGPIEPLVATSFRENYPAVSHDGRWVAFVSDESGRDEVYVRSLNAGGVSVQVSQGGGDEPVWAHSGRELFYRGTVNGVPQLMSASVSTTPSFAVTGRRALFAISDYVQSTPHSNYDVSPDDKTFAMVRRNPTTRIVILQNLPEVVRRLAGQPGK